MFVCERVHVGDMCVRETTGEKKDGIWNQSTSLCLCVGLHLSLCVYVCYSTAAFYCLYCHKMCECVFVLGGRLSVYQCVLGEASH